MKNADSVDTKSVHAGCECAMREASRAQTTAPMRRNPARLSSSLGHCRNGMWRTGRRTLGRTRNGLPQVASAEHLPACDIASRTRLASGAGRFNKQWPVDYRIGARQTE